MQLHGDDIVANFCNCGRRFRFINLPEILKAGRVVCRVTLMNIVFGWVGWFGVSLGLLAVAARAQTLPAIQGTSLNNQKVTVPEAGKYKALVLVVGFSHKSGRSG